MDATPRLITNLVSMSFITDNPFSVGTHSYDNPMINPAAVEAVTDFYGVSPFLADGVTPNPAYLGDPDVAVIPNAGVLGGGRLNAWFTALGQFFDHGLDFVEKGANGTVAIEIKPGDPLYISPTLPGGVLPNPYYVAGVSNWMYVSRANLANPDTDFVTEDGTGYLKDGADPLYNNTGMLIDQSQTYGSHETVNAFFREYDAAGAPTGRVVAHAGVDINGDGEDDDLATWADTRANALKIGVVLTDEDIFNAPMLRVDVTGKLLFTPDPTGHVGSADVIAGPQDPNDPFMRDGSVNVLFSGQAFLIDINPAADPHFMMDGPGYDAALLNDHFVSGDGRVNENCFLTDVHFVFHSEHNHQVHNVQTAAVKEAMASGDVTNLNAWLLSPTDTGLLPVDDAGIPAFVDSLTWNGESLFQAVRLMVETEYNHIAVDQFVGTLYAALPEFVSYSADINMGVSLEFGQAVYRLGHSMLTGTIKEIDPVTGVVTDTPLLDAFLNPHGFDDDQAITLGLTQTYGNEIDEFVTPALQQSLLGQPLDLGAINIARGRDVGLPTLNELRQQISDGLTEFTSGNGSGLAPYVTWQDFGAHMKHAGTVVNLIAAYVHDDGDHDWGIAAARDAYLNSGGSLDAIRDAAQALMNAYNDTGNADHDAAVLFMEGDPTYNDVTAKVDFVRADMGFWDVDLWLGGLAERPLFDGPLGTTFSYVFLDIAQRMQDGDRFYYLYRTPMGTNLGNEIIGNHFGDLVQRATGLTHLAVDVFITPDAVFELDGTVLTDVDANNNINDFFDATTKTITFSDLTTGPASDGHVVIAGNESNGTIKGGLGDDTLYGDDGNDVLEGSQGNDHIYGGSGNDYITDDENDDFIRGGDGDDIVFAGPGTLDTVFGDAGDDELHGEGDADVLFGGLGNVAASVTTTCSAAMATTCWKAASARRPMTATGWSARASSTLRRPSPRKTISVSTSRPTRTSTSRLRPISKRRTRTVPGRCSISMWGSTVLSDRGSTTT